MRQQHRHQGSTLLEVMIAVLIIGIGLLGVASLQVASLQGANDADFRSRATDIAVSLADRLRANAGADDDYRVSAPADCDTPPDEICAMTPDAAVISKAPFFPACTPQQMAVHDVWEIQCLNGVQDILPSGSLTVTCANGTATDPCPDDTTFTISVTWQMRMAELPDPESESESESEVKTVTLETETVTLSVIPGAPL